MCRYCTNASVSLGHTNNQRTLNNFNNKNKDLIVWKKHFHTFYPFRIWTLYSGQRVSSFRNMYAEQMIRVL